MKRFSLFLLTLALLAMTGPVGASPGTDTSTDEKRYVEGQVVRISVYHVHFPGSETTIDIYRAGTDELVAQYYVSDAEREAQRVVWNWDQRQACYGQCQNVWEGDPAGPGAYEVRTDLGNEDFARFSIGAYFHVGFEGRPNADFTVFSNQPDVVQQMRAELERPQEERQIVAGIVRARKPGYNSEWTYILGPRSIFLGEVFIEVCDGSPYYVQRHLHEWRGEQWCPWSSYVSSEGL